MGITCEKAKGIQLLIGPIKTNGQYSTLKGDQYTCKFCATKQVVPIIFCDMGFVEFRIRQCLHCSQPDINLTAFYENNGSFSRAFDKTLYPTQSIRPPILFEFCNSEVRSAYEEACQLFPVHAGASGAYARRAIEIILDNAGYQSKSLAEAIGAAANEADPDKKLPKRLIQKLNYVKEIGTFALHVRRDGELSIVPISSEEVSACLEIVEELISTLFDEPGKDYARTIEANEKLRASGKKEIELPPMPEGFSKPPEDS